MAWLRWEQWVALQHTLRTTAEDGWYVYCVGQDIPSEKSSGENFNRMPGEIDNLLRRDHLEEYLGIVYVDNFDMPTLVKIYDPHNLGSSCGPSGQFIPPAWIISRMTPEPIQNPNMIPQGRQRWWKKLADWLGDQPSIAQQQ